MLLQKRHNKGVSRTVPLCKGNNPASRSICFCLGHFQAELDWGEYGKEGRKTDARSKRFDLLGKVEGVSSSGERG